MYGTLLHNRNILPAFVLTLAVHSFIFAQEKILLLSQDFISVPNNFFLYAFFFKYGLNPRTFKTTQVQMTGWQEVLNININMHNFA